MYSLIIWKYFWQIRAAGSVIRKVEGEKLRLEDQIGLFQKLSHRRTKFYGSNWALAFIIFYILILVLLPLFAAVQLRS